MTDNKDTNNQKPGNDISEMLRLLRESVESEKKEQNEKKEYDEEVSAADDEIKATLEKVFEEFALDTPKNDDEDDDFFDEEENESWFSLEDDERNDEEEKTDDEILEDALPSETEIDAEEESEEMTEEPAISVEMSEEDPDDKSPWYDEAPATEIDAEEESEEMTEEPAISVEMYEEDPDDESPWYDEAPTTEENIETECVDEASETINPLANNEEWYAVSTPFVDEAVTGEDEKEEEISTNESLWYNEENDSSDEMEEADDPYQDDAEESEPITDSEYDPDIEDFENEIINDTPENDYTEENVYIYDSEKGEEDDDVVYGEESDELVLNEDETTDGTDINLLTTLGLSVNGDDTEHPDEDNSEVYSGNISFDYNGGEYVLENQRHEIHVGYKQEKKLTQIRLVAGGILAFLLLIYEILAAIGADLPGMLDPVAYPVSHMLMSVQLLVIVALLSVKSIYIGFCDLFTNKATPYSVSAVVVAVNLLYSIIAVIIYSEGTVLFNCFAALTVVAAVGGEYLMLVSEEHIFDVFSDKKQKRYALVNDEASPEMSPNNSLALKAVRSDFGKNYFLRMRKRPGDYNYLSYLLPAVAAVGFLTFFVCLLCRCSGYASLRNGVLVFNMGIPVGIFATFSYPIYRATVKALGRRGTMVGHSAADEYSKTRFVTLGEEELFSSLKTTHLDLKPSGDNDVSNVLNKTGMLLAAIGGPMKSMVEVMQGDFMNANVTLDEVFDDGISAYADGVEMLAGSAQFLKCHGVEVDESTDFKDVDPTSEVLYISIDGRLAARYYLKYKVDAEFVKLVNALGARGISVGVKTVNPGINSEIIARRCPELKYKVYTIKTKSDSNDAIGITDSGIVALEKPLLLIYPLLAAYDLKKYYSIDKIVRIATSAIGVAIGIICVILGAAVKLSSLWLIICHALWIIPVVLFGLLHFRQRAKRKKTK